MREFLEIERLNEMSIRQELEFASTSKVQRDKVSGNVFNKDYQLLINSIFFYLPFIVSF